MPFTQPSSQASRQPSQAPIRLALLSTSDTDLLSARASGAEHVLANPSRPGQAAAGHPTTGHSTADHSTADRAEHGDERRATTRICGSMPGKGAFELAATVDYLFGVDATAGAVHDWMYDRLAHEYVLDETHQEFLRRSNPWALRGIVETLHGAAERGPRAA